jgi:hypothetical protein
LEKGADAMLLRVIGFAGGLAEGASKRGVRIRRVDGSVISVNLDPLFSGERPDVPLQDGDVIIIKGRFF